MSKYFLVWLALLGILGNLNAQSAADIRKKYEYGKQLVDQKKYAQARIVLESINQDNPKNLLVEYCHYLYATACFNSNHEDEAINTLEHLVSEHGDWENINEVKVSLAGMLADKGDFLTAATIMASVPSKKLDDATKTSEKSIWAKLSYEDMQKLYSQFPKQERIGKGLLAKALHTPKDKRDEAQTTKLIAQYGGDQKEAYTKVMNAGIKDVYNIGVMMPFYEDKVDPTSLSIKNEFVYNIYQGIKLGQEQLTKEGIKIELFAYDTKRDSAVVEQLLASPVMANIDLIIGPLYGDMLPIVKRYADSTGTPMVNPISMHPRVLEDSEQSYLTAASYNTQGKQLARYLHSQQDTAKAYIIYGASTKEKALAEAYKDEFESLGGVVQVFQEYDYADGFTVAQESFTPLAMDTLGVALDSTSAHVIISTTKEIPSMNVLSALQSLKALAPVYVPDDWLTFEQLGFSQLEGGHVTIIAPEYVNPDTNNVRMIDKEYQQRFNNIASDFTYKGFETIYFFGKVMHLHGKYFQNKLHETGFQNGFIYPGHDYTNANDNQYVPLIKFQQGKLVLINKQQEGENASKDKE
ncbi:ABC transporter substrate-binding protein [Limibacter armeniacum]|uniref:ABC transporter substrate-binding protein n=1 Tax=Limibacter armeniacum TaxID=466084 RepID=UPI002FE6725F